MSKQMNELAKLINKKLSKSLQTDVSKVARNTLKEHVVKDVYDAYTPESYERTGGLLQDRNIEVKMENDNTLSVRSTRHEGSKDIAYTIEYGEGYSPSSLDEVIGARPFHKETAKELNQGLAKKALADGLRKQGLDVK
ncbi:hypothetical protein [Metabacillus fastidiosus]|uniref:hypothetical protein n=1 Tax=Metabacillus fastidiosus TaxID=1458 RepID=UPI003D2DD624